MYCSSSSDFLTRHMPVSCGIIFCPERARTHTHTLPARHHPGASIAAGSGVVQNACEPTRAHANMRIYHMHSSVPQAWLNLHNTLKKPASLKACGPQKKTRPMPCNHFAHDSHMPFDLITNSTHQESPREEGKSRKRGPAAAQRAQGGPQTCRPTPQWGPCSTAELGARPETRLLGNHNTTPLVEQGLTGTSAACCAHP